MAKSKEQRKQEKKAAMQEAKKEQARVDATPKQETEDKAKEPETKTEVKPKVQTEQISLTMYTAMYMCNLFVCSTYSFLLGYIWKSR